MYLKGIQPSLMPHYLGLRPGSWIQLEAGQFFKRTPNCQQKDIRVKGVTSASCNAGHASKWVGDCGALAVFYPLSPPCNSACIHVQQILLCTELEANK